MNCVITSVNIFSGQSAVTSRIFPVQSAVSVRKSTPDRPFVCPILVIRWGVDTLPGYGHSIIFQCACERLITEGLRDLVAYCEERLRNERLALNSE